MPYNPAMLADDLTDVYMMAKRTLKNNKKDQDSDQSKPVVPPSFPEYLAAKEAAIKKMELQSGFSKESAFTMPDINKANMLGVAKGVKNYLLSPQTTALTLGGLYTSAYGPEWAGGPSENDLATTGRFNRGRALKSVVTWNTLGRAISNIPKNTETLISSKSKLKRLTSAASVLPGVAGGAVIADNIIKGKEPDLKKAKKRYKQLGALSLGTNLAGAGYENMAEDISNRAAEHIFNNGLY